jgi:hypothetical protein
LFTCFQRLLFHLEPTHPSRTSRTMIGGVRYALLYRCMRPLIRSRLAARVTGHTRHSHNNEALNSAAFVPSKKQHSGDDMYSTYLLWLRWSNTAFLVLKWVPQDTTQSLEAHGHNPTLSSVGIERGDDRFRPAMECQCPKAVKCLTWEELHQSSFAISVR